MLLILPRATPQTVLQQEECCWSRVSSCAPALAIHAAVWLRNLKHNVTVSAVPVDAPPPAEPYAMIVSWPYGDELTPLAQRAEIIFANPQGAESELTARFPNAKVIPSSSAFAPIERLPLEVIPVPVWSTFRTIMVQFSSGCPWQCGFCVWNHRYTIRQAAKVAQDVTEYLRRVPGAAKDPTGASIFLLGNEITGKPTWLRALCAAMPPGIRWTADVNARNTTLEDLTVAWNAGLRRTCLGIEFLTDRMLALLGKGHTVTQALQTMTWLQELGIPYRFSLRSGVGETPIDLAELERNLRAMHSAGLTPDHIYCGPMAQWPGHPWLDTSVPRVNLGTERYPRFTRRLDEDVKLSWQSVFTLCRSFNWPIS